jgi:predicted transposase/invertase (TIGR01784 family)
VATRIDDAEIEGKLETARNMLAKGISADIVSECTGLSIDDIRSIGM